MKTTKLFLTVILLFVLKTMIAQNWYSHYSFIGSDNINAVDFNYSDMGGVICGDLGLIGGWQICISDIWCNSTSPTSSNLYSIKTVDSSGITKAYIVGENGKILKSNLIPYIGAFDSYIQNSPTTNNLYSVYFTSYSTGIAVGDNGTVIRTTNGGNQWNIISNITPNRLYSVHFPSTNIGYAVGNDGIVIKTTDNGQSWNIKTQPIVDTLRCVWFVDDNIGFVISRNGAILKTTDGGNNWQTKPSGISENLNAIRFVNQTTGYAAGNNNKIVKTTDAGETWLLQTLPTLLRYGDFLSIAKTYTDEICIVGTNGTAVGSFPDDVSINEKQNENNILIFPNPGCGKLIVNNAPLNSCFVLCNNYGQVVITQSLNQINSINTNNLQSGIYFYHLIGCNGKVLSMGKWMKVGE